MGNAICYFHHINLTRKTICASCTEYETFQCNEDSVALELECRDGETDTDVYFHRQLGSFRNRKTEIINLFQLSWKSLKSSFQELYPIDSNALNSFSKAQFTVYKLWMQYNMH